MIDLHRTYQQSDGLARFATIALLLFFAASIVLSTFLSPLLVFGFLAAAILLFTSFAKPTWVLMGLLFYLPFEPFLLKWIPDELYAYARFGSEGLIYILAAVVVWWFISKRITYQSTVLDLPFALFLVALIASALINLTDPLDALLGMRQIIRFILLYFVTIHLVTEKVWVKRFFIGVAVIVAIQSLLGFSQFIFGQPVDTFLFPSVERSVGDIALSTGGVQTWDFGQRVFGTFGRYDRLGTFLAFFLLVGVAMLYEKKIPTKYIRFILPITLMALPILLLTYSRSAWFGFLLGFFFIGLYIYKDRRVAIGAGMGAVALLLYLAFSGLVVNRLIDTAEQSVAERFFEAFSIKRWEGEYYGLGRLYWIVNTVTRVVPASPIFGHGPASYGGGAVAALTNHGVYEQLGLPFGVYGTDGYIDNNWFSLWGETGTVGLAMYIWMIAALFAMCIRVYRKSDDSFTRSVALGVAAAILAVSLNAFLATFLEVRTLASYLWVCTGLVVVLARLEKLEAIE